MAGSFWPGLRPASFRGVPFDAFEEHSEAGGRRLVRHEFPLRDTPYAEDMGRKAGQWQVEAFVLRNRWADYEAARDRLRDALNAAGPGTLIHPWLGQMSVAVDSYTLRESTREGGYCKFSITFVEAGSLTCPDIQADTAAGVEEAVNAAEEAAEESFLERLNMLPEDLESALSFAEGIADTVINCLNTGSRLLSDVKSQIRRVIAIPDRLAGALLGLVTSAMGLSSLSGLGGTAGSSGSSDSGAPYSFGGFDQDAFSAMLSTRRDGPDEPWEGAAPGASGAGNSCSRRLSSAWAAPGASGAGVSTVADRVYAPIIDYVAAVTVAELARQAADTEFSTADDALAAFEIVIGALDSVQAAHCADAVYAALDDLRAALAEDMVERGAKLPRLGTARLAATMPALAASHRIYGTAAYADEIVSRNNIRHPGRVPGGVNLEIVRHD